MNMMLAQHPDYAKKTCQTASQTLEHVHMASKNSVGEPCLVQKLHGNLGPAGNAVRMLQKLWQRIAWGSSQMKAVRQHGM